MYAQPLFLPNVRISKNIHNVVFVATEHDSVYAFDADQTTAIAPLWKTSFLRSTVATVPAIDLFQKYSNKDISPEIGITGTPVIDPTAGILYVATMTKENGRQYVQQLHALDVKTGSEKRGSPITIQASVPGTGNDNSDGTIRFTARAENQRSALLLSNGVVYVSWASFGDSDPYPGRWHLDERRCGYPSDNEWDHPNQRVYSYRKIGRRSLIILTFTNSGNPSTVLTERIRYR